MGKKYTYRSTTSPEISAREMKHFERTRALAGDCTVLLRNDGALPILCAGQKVALYGEGGRNTVRGGTGSGMTYARHDYSVEEALETAGFTVTTKAWLDRQDARRKQEFEDFMERMRQEAGAGLELMLMGGTPPTHEAEPVTDQDIADSDTDTAVFVLVRSGRRAGPAAVSGHHFHRETFCGQQPRSEPYVLQRPRVRTDAQGDLSEEFRDRDPHIPAGLHHVIL